MSDLNEKLHLEQEVEELKKHNRALLKRLEETKHPKHGYGKHRYTKDVQVRWDFDHINEMMHILVKLKHNKGIVLELSEGSFYDRGTPLAVFPRYFVRGAMEGDVITAYELRELGIDIAKDIPDCAIIKKESFVPVGCELEHDEETNVVYGNLRFEITEPFGWEPLDG